MIGAYIRGALRDVSEYADAALNETNVRIAVTGLSRAGKTVFLTSLIHNLLALGRGRDTLPALRECLKAEGVTRLHSIRIAPPGASAIPHFEYENKLADLACGSPTWPTRTENLAQIALEFEVERTSLIAQRLGRRRIRLELLDYPGEWLIDLPLLDQTYAEWSKNTLALLRQAPRQAASTSFLEFLTAIRPSDAADEALIARGHALYRDALEKCRRMGLRYLQPGRFLCPGPRGNVPLLWFFPIDHGGEHGSRSSLARLLHDRFEAYKADSREQFFDTYFADFDRQIFLVDVLSALHAGKAAFDDVERAITEIARQLRYGANWLPRPVGRIANGALRHWLSSIPLPARVAEQAAQSVAGRRLERVAFVATKADHVPGLRREHLKNLVRALAETARSNELLGGRPVTYHAVASVLSTVDGTAKIDGRPVEVVLGLPLGEDRQRPFYPGDVPSGRPPDSFWSERFFELPVFAPPKIDPTGTLGIPHLGLDEVLVGILKDVL
jgi:uncharacterized protein